MAFTDDPNMLSDAGRQEWLRRRQQIDLARRKAGLADRDAQMASNLQRAQFADRNAQMATADQAARFADRNAQMEAQRQAVAAAYAQQYGGDSGLGFVPPMGSSTQPGYPAGQDPYGAGYDPSTQGGYIGPGSGTPMPKLPYPTGDVTKGGPGQSFTQDPTQADNVWTAPGYQPPTGVNSIYYPDINNVDMSQVSAADQPSLQALLTMSKMTPAQLADMRARNQALKQQQSDYRASLAAQPFNQDAYNARMAQAKGGI